MDENLPVNRSYDRILCKWRLAVVAPDLVRLVVWSIELVVEGGHNQDEVGEKGGDFEVEYVPAGELATARERVDYGWN